METSFEVAGLSTGFIILLGIAYRVFKNSNFQFSSSCKKRLVEEATHEIRDRVRQVIEEELSKSKSASPMYGATSPRIPELPPTPKI